MKVLHLTNAYPTVNKSYFGIFVKNQVDCLMRKGISISVKEIGRFFGGYRKVFFIRKEVDSADLIHCHFGHVGTICLPWRFLKHKPVVVSYCGSDILGNRGMKQVFFSRINSFFSRFPDCAIVMSSEMAAKIKARKKKIIPYGTNTELFKEIDISHARNMIGLKDYKGALVLFLGEKRVPVKNFCLFSKSLAHLNIEFKYLVLEDIPYAEVPYYMNAADVCVLTSHYEGSPNVIKEAMSCNRPIVSVDVGDVRGFLDGLRGCFIVDRDHRQIADAIKKAMEFRKTDARQRIFELGFDLDATAEKIVKVYREIYN